MAKSAVLHLLQRYVRFLGCCRTLRILGHYAGQWGLIRIEMATNHPTGDIAYRKNPT